LSSGMSIATTVAAAGLLVEQRAIGAYALVRFTGGGVSGNATTAGSNLRLAGGEAGPNTWYHTDSGGIPAGTWRNMGQSTSLNDFGFCQRIS
jgi:hypothetical protein